MAMMLPSNNFNIGCSVKSYRGGVDGIVPYLSQPVGQRWRKRHVDEEFHFAETVGCNSMASFSARKAA